MNTLLTRLLVVSLLAVCASAQGAADDDYVLMVLGDSLSAAYGIDEEDGWVALLDNKLRNDNWPYRVVNGSVSGETTTGGLARLPAMLDSHQPDLVILELGGNDGLRGLPLGILKSNMLIMIALIEEQGAEVLLTGIQIPPNYGPRYTVPFYQLYGQLAAEKTLALVPFLIEGIPQQPELMQNDGIHPRAEAQYMILDNVWVVLEAMLQKH
ncbi:MAG TPA: arylesterase [Porticoccaceae bacterium]|nr:arylesterase [Gammaproteobacteria bacterium]HIL59756.1 arylesterase [Porticoccaceae bacterium]